MTRRRNKRNKSRSLYLWHRYTGLFAATFVVFLSVTGIALNHTDDLALKKHHVSSDILLDVYNVQAPVNITQFSTRSNTITQVDGFLYVNSGDVISTNDPAQGAVEFGDFTAIALSNSILLTDSNNHLVETLRLIDDVPNNIQRIGIGPEANIFLLSNQQLYHMSEDLSFNRTPQTNIRNIDWSIPSTLSAQEKTAVIQRYKSNIISLETLMLDIHSGRIFGTYGTLFFDFVALVLLFLAGTGIIIWVKQRPKET